MLSSFHWAFTVAVFTIGATLPSGVQAQDQRDEQFYYPGSFNWQFLNTYPEGARLFNAFDYGHAVLYERLYTKRGRAREALEKEYRFLTTDLLVRPPRFAVVEELISPAYSKIAWRAKLMFDWAHVLHRQIYDVYADERLPMAQKDSLIERLTDYYLSRKEYAFAALPKSMDLMEGQYFSRTFRRAYPTFNGLIWAYHWLQVGLYEPLLDGKIPAEKKAGVKATVARFWTMLEDPPSRMPKMMPMTSAIAPRFSERHPRAAAIFDNLHMMHDIISDILTTDTIPYNRKREMIYAQLDELKDTTRNVISWDEWRNMGEMMGGVDVMGGPATGLLAAVHAPVTPTPDMAGMEHGAMRHEAGAMRHEGAGGGKPDTTRKKKMDGMHDAARGGADSSHMRQMMDLHMRMMADPVIRKRVMADTGMRRLMTEVMHSAEMGHRKHMDGAAPKPDVKKRGRRERHEGHRPQPGEPSGPDEPGAKPRSPERPPRPQAPVDSHPHYQGHSLGPTPIDDATGRTA
jgi:hypothetical protein